MNATNIPEHVKAEYPDEWFFGYRERFLRHLMAAFTSALSGSGRQPPLCVDIGCNTGRYTGMLADLGLRVVGLDRSETMVREASAAFPELEFRTGDALALPFDDGSLDGAVAFGTIQCVEQWEMFIGEMFRVLRPGGFGLVETNRAFPFLENLARSLAYVLKRDMSLAEVVGFFRSHGAASPLQGLKFGPMKFAVRDLLIELHRRPVASVWVHDPRKRRWFHDFSCAVVFEKAGLDPSSTGPVVRVCPDCRKRGIQGLSA